jgi:glucan biosynthesis protein
MREVLRLTFRRTAEQVNIDRERVRKFLTEALEMRKGCTKMVPKKLTEEQKQRSITIRQEILETQDDFLGCVITVDETWVYQYDPETRRQNAHGRLTISYD